MGLAITTWFCIYFVSGQAVKIGVLYDGGRADQIDEWTIKRAVLSHPTDFPTAGEREANQDLQLLWRPVNSSNTVFALEEVCDLIDSGIQGLVTALPCRSRQYIMSQADVFRLPHVSVSTESCETRTSGQYTLQTGANSSLLASLVTDVMWSMSWHSAGLILDDSVDSVQRKNLVLSLSASMVESSIVLLEDPVQGRPLTGLSRLVGSDSEAIIARVKASKLRDVLSQSHHLGLLTPSYFWILLIDDLIPEEAASVLRPYVDSNIMLVRLAWSGSRRSTDGHCQLVHCLQETSCTQFCPYLSATLADAISVLFQASLTVRTSEPSKSTLTSCLMTTNYTIPGSEQVMEAIFKGNRPGFTACQSFTPQGFPTKIEYELFSLYNTSNSPYQLVASWDSQNGLSTSDEEKLFLNKFYDFGGRVLTIATLESKPFCLPVKKNNETVFTGFAFDILNELAARLKFRYVIVEPPDRLYGAPNPDGSWNGMVGMVKRGEVDLAVGPFTITSIRESVIDFTKPYLEDSTGILTRKPQDEDSQLFQMFKPYSGEVWGAIAAATFLVGVISFLVNYHTPYSGIRQGVNDSTTDEISFSENLWLIYSSAMEQGATYHPNATSGRLVLGFFWIFTIVIVATYTANLAAFLTVSMPYTPINSLGELLAQKQVQPVVKNGTNLWAMFSTSKKGIYVDVWERLQNSPRATVTEDALKLVETGRYAYMSDTALLKYIALSGCKFAVANEVFNTAGYGFVMPENAPFETAVNYNIMKMQEAGLIEKWRQKWWTSETESCGSEERTGSATSLSLSHLGGAFLVYIIVAGISIVCLGLEIIGKTSGILRKLRGQFQQSVTAKTNGFQQNGKHV